MAKATFDFCVLSESGVCLWRGRLNNDGQSIKDFLAQLRARSWKLSQIHFAVESSGVYGNKLLGALHQAGLAGSVLNPAQVKYFAFSVLRWTKERSSRRRDHRPLLPGTRPLATRPLRPIEEQLKLLVHERESRVAEQTREHNRAKRDPFQIVLPTLISHQCQQRLKQLEEEIAELDAAIDSLIAGDQCLKRQSQLLCSIAGIAEIPPLNYSPSWLVKSSNRLTANRLWCAKRSLGVLAK